jgi:hypothetical protein
MPNPARRVVRASVAVLAVSSALLWARPASAQG